MPPTQPPHKNDAGSPVGEGIAWASRIIAIGLAMFLPGVVGGWLDTRWGTRFLGPAGLVLGLITSLAWLVQLDGRKRR